MLYALGPAQIADVDQAVDTLFDLDKRAEVGEVADPAFNGRADGILVMERVPGIRSKLTHAQGNTPLLRIDAQHHAINLIAHVDQLGGMLDALGPRHLADVYQAFDSLLQFHERAVVGDADDASTDMRAYGIAVGRIQPRVGCELLESQRDPLLVLVELQHFYLDLVADVDQVAGMGQTSPRHIGDVQQAVDSAQVHESAVLGQILHHSGQHCAFFQVLQSL